MRASFALLALGVVFGANPPTGLTPTALQVFEAVRERLSEALRHTPSDGRKKAMLQVLSARHNATPLGTPTVTLLRTDLSRQPGEAGYLLCLCEKADAGLVSQQRHLVECALLAVKLKRTLITPPMMFTHSRGLRYIDEMVDVNQLRIPGFQWQSGRSARAEPNATAIVDMRSSTSRHLPLWVSELLRKQVHFHSVKERQHNAAQALATIGRAAESQQTVIMVFPSEEQRNRASRSIDALVAQLQPLDWFTQLASLTRQQLFNEEKSRYLAMHLVRGVDLAKCLARFTLKFNGTSGSSVGRLAQSSDPRSTPRSRTSASSHSNWEEASGDSGSGDGGSDSSQTPTELTQVDRLFRLMDQCYHGDKAVEAVITNIRHRYGPMGVYISTDEQGEESLKFFQEHGYKTRLDAAVMRAHLSGADSLFLDHVICREADIFIGSQISKQSKQIVSLRDAVNRPSFILKVNT